MDKATKQKFFSEKSELYREITNTILEIYQYSTEPLLQRFDSFLEAGPNPYSPEVYSELRTDLLCAFVVETKFLYNDLRRQVLRFHELEQNALEQLKEISELKEKVQRLEYQSPN